MAPVSTIPDTHTNMPAALVFEQFYLDCLSQASYLIGDRTTGRAVVVDPRRDVGEYLESAREHDLTIEFVIETHLHADFVSGHLEVADATGAAIAYGSGANTEFASRELRDGEQIVLGEVALEIRATPGHTPESICVVVWDLGQPSAQPWGVLTGDTLFVGDVGRPDLLVSAGRTSEELAELLHRSLHDKLMTLPDDTIVWPGHGAGSACGKNLSTEVVSSIGEQRRTNQALLAPTAEAFVAMVTESQSHPPAYFRFDVHANRANRQLLDEQQPVAVLTREDLTRHHEAGGVVLDTRDLGSFTSGHIPGALFVGLDGRFAEFAGSVINPEQNIALVCDSGTEIEARNRLARIGFDCVVGAHVLTAIDQHSEVPLQSAPRKSFSDLVDVDGSNDYLFVDVRQPAETEGGMIPTAIAVPLTTLLASVGDLDPKAPTLVYCAGGFRSMIAASFLRSHGFANVSDLVGGYGAWTALAEQ